jgi:hypothetical protein
LTTHTTDRAPQFMQALEKANSTRLAFASVKRQLAAGDITLAQALDEPCVQNLDIREVLCAQRRWGDVRAEKALLMIPITGRKPIRKLTDRQRQQLIRLCAINADIRRAA